MSVKGTKYARVQEHVHVLSITAQSIAANSSTTSGASEACSTTGGGSEASTTTGGGSEACSTPQSGGSAVCSESKYERGVSWEEHDGINSKEVR